MLPLPAGEGWGGGPKLQIVTVGSIRFFDFSEAADAVPGNDILKIASFTGLYQDIRVQKRRPQPFGQQHAYGAFTGPGHPDEYQILFCIQRPKPFTIWFSVAIM